MGAFLEPGETYEIAISSGTIICRSMSFRQQREVMKLIKQLQKNEDPEVAMDCVEKIIASSLASWVCREMSGTSTLELLDHVSFAEAMSIAKKITEGGQLSETERKK
jgi:hypothetical protein